MASLTDILSALQSGVQVVSALQQTQAQLVPALTSGLLSADALVQPGFVRVLGVSVVDGSVAGFLHDAAALGDAGADNQVYVVGTTKGYTATNMVFKNGLVFKIGTGNKAAVFYSRV